MRRPVLSSDRTWSPHPLHKPGILLVGLAQLTAGLFLVLDGVFFHTLPVGWRAYGIPLLVVLAAAALYFGPPGRRRSGMRAALAVGLLLVVVFALLMVRLGPAIDPRPSVPAGIVLLVFGAVAVYVSEHQRRKVQVRLVNDEVVVFLRRYRVEHTLPLEAVRDMVASRPLGGRIWGYGDFTARVRKGTMKDNLTKPVVGEEPPEDANAGNGWDEEERFHLVAGHPYKALRRDLERRILLARMSPKDREEQELADRLAQDLGGLKA